MLVYHPDQPHGTHVSVPDCAVYSGGAVRGRLGVSTVETELGRLLKAPPSVVFLYQTIHRDSGRKDCVRGYDALATSPGLLLHAIPEDQRQLRKRDYAVEFFAAAASAAAI